MTFQINEKERIGLVGVNGTGKSTLLKVMAGLEPLEQGKLIHANHFHVEYLPQNPSFDPDSTVLEQVFFGDTPIMQALRNMNGRLPSCSWLRRMKSGRPSCLPRSSEWMPQEHGMRLQRRRPC